MSKIIIASARHDERGKYVGGKNGDQKQSGNGDDFKGEVSMQEFYEHYKGWMVIRPKTYQLADNIASIARVAANNPNLGYDQNCQRRSPDNLNSKIPIDIDCSKLIRDIIKAASGKDPGNFTTASEAEVLAKTGLFEKAFRYKNTTATPLYDGDILVTCTKGHTAAVVEGNDRPDKLKTLQDTTPAKPVAQSTQATPAKTPTATSAEKLEAARLKNRLYTGTFRVTASSLNLRTGAGTNKNIIITIPKGEAVYCYGYYTDFKGIPWLLVTYKKEGKTYTGFASKKYLLKI